MTELRPVLLMLVPADWDAIPEGLAELRRCVAEDYEGSLMLRQATVPLHSPLPLWVGYWPVELLRFAKRDLRPRIAEAFSSLSWLDLDEVS